MSDGANPQQFAGERVVPRIELQVLLRFMKTHLWTVTIVILLTEALISVASALVMERFRAHALVRMGKVEDRDQGSQGAVVEKVRTELEEVTLILRPYGIVQVFAEGEDSQQAVSLARQATERLIHYSTLAMEETLAVEHEKIRDIETSIEGINVEILSLHERMKRENIDGLPIVLPSRSGEFQSLIHSTAAAYTLGALISQRSKLREELMRIKFELVYKVTTPHVIAQPAAPTKPFRPNWMRNLSLGAGFGLAFGLVVLALIGVFQQLNSQQVRH